MSITNYYPTVEESVGVLEFGATIEADSRTDNFYLKPSQSHGYNWKPDVQLKVTIADNSTYTNADIYSTAFDNSPNEAAITHAIKETGTYYIKMETEDIYGTTNDLLEYTIDIYQIIYFIDEPSINTTGPKANKITVRSETASATATTDPAPPADEIVHSKVEIDTGDAAVCQEVANKLIENWGREQVTVSGNVNLIVTLRFKERVRVIVPNAGIDRFMKIQKKEHNITDKITSLIVGDIQLSESELLARILDDLNA